MSNSTCTKTLLILMFQHEHSFFILQHEQRKVLVVDSRQNNTQNMGSSICQVLIS